MMNSINYQDIQNSLRKYCPTYEQFPDEFKSFFRLSQEACIQYFQKELVNTQGKDGYGFTLLHWAIHEGLLDKVKLLFDRGVSANQWWEYQTKRIYPLYLAIMAGNKEIFDYVIKNSKEHLNEPSPIGNLLHAAIYANQPKILSQVIVELASQNRCLVEEESNAYVTPLQLAAFLGHVECACILVKQGLNLNQGESQKRGTAVFYAAIGRQPEMIRALYQLGANLSAIDSEGVAAKFLIRHDLSPRAIQCYNLLNDLSMREHKVGTHHPSIQIFPPVNLMLSGTWYEQSILAGVIQYLDDEKLLLHVTRVAGSSISSLTAALLATGSTPVQIKQQLREVNQFLDEADSSNKEGKKLIGTRLLHWIESCIHKNTGKKNLTFKDFYQLRRGHSEKYKELYLSLKKTQDNQPICMGDPSHKQWDHLIISHVVYAAIIPEHLFDPHPIECHDGTRSYFEGGSFSSLTPSDMNPLPSLFDELKHQNSYAFGKSSNRRTLIIEACYQYQSSSEATAVIPHHFSIEEHIRSYEKKMYANSPGKSDHPKLHIQVNGGDVEALFNQGKEKAQLHFQQLMIDLKDENSLTKASDLLPQSPSKWKWRYKIFVKQLPYELAFQDIEAKAYPEKKKGGAISERITSTHHISIQEPLNTPDDLDRNYSLTKGVSTEIEREELNGLIDEQINNASDYPIKIALVGFEGIGATTAAMGYARKQEKDASFKAYQIKGEQLSLMSLELKERIRNRLRTLLKWILIIDKVNALAAGEEYYEKDLLPSSSFQGQKGIVLITFRPTQQKIGQGYHKIFLKPFSLKEVKNLFQKQEKPIDEALIPILQERFAFFPSMLNTCIEWVHKINWTASDLLKSPEGLREIWEEINMDIFKEEKDNSSFLRTVLIHFSFLGPYSIPGQLFNPKFFGISLRKYRDIHQLFTLHLLQASQDEHEQEGGYHQMHPLLQEQIRCNFEQKAWEVMVVSSDHLRGLTTTAIEIFNKNRQALTEQIRVSQDSHNSTLAKQHLSFLLTKIAPRFPDNFFGKTDAELSSLTINNNL